MAGKTDAEILVPLTTSLYVPGKLADREKVIVDIGTGFYVEKVQISPLSLSPQKSFLEALLDIWSKSLVLTNADTSDRPPKMPSSSTTAR
jgi:hypothetical protein